MIPSKLSLDLCAKLYLNSWCRSTISHNFEERAESSQVDCLSHARETNCKHTFSPLLGNDLHARFPVMGLFQRLFTFSLGGKSKNNQKKKNSGEPVLHASQSVNNLLTTTHPNRDQQAAVNRLLRSSSTHFSILSETDYHSLPPIRELFSKVLGSYWL